MKAIKTEKMLKKYGIKPCNVNLKRYHFKKIRIHSSVTLNTGDAHVPLKCKIQQEDINTFSIKIKAGMD